MNKIVRNSVILGMGSFLLVDLPVFIQLGLGIRTEPINFPDLIDILLFVPFMIAVLYMFYYDLHIEDNRYRVSYVSASAVFFEGHGVHWAANAVDLLQHCEDASCLSKFGEAAESQKLAYLLDEIIGHRLMYYPFFIILFLLLLLDRKTEISEKERVLLYVSGAFFGFYLIVATVEGQTGIECILFMLLVVVFSVYKRGFREIKNYPFTMFMFVSSLVGLALGLSWWAYWGALVEPSKILHF